MKIVRDGKKVWPYCSDCGCRLMYSGYSNTEYRVNHFGPGWEEDARGCRCKSLYQAWVVPKHRLNHIGV